MGGSTFGACVPNVDPPILFPGNTLCMLPKSGGFNAGPSHFQFRYIFWYASF